MTKEEEKYFEEYGEKITSALDVLFDPDNENYIDLENGNPTLFIHLLATSVPNVIFRMLSGEHKNELQFNHLANQLCFQYMVNLDRIKEYKE